MIVQKKLDDQSQALDVLWFVDKKDLNDEERVDILVPSGHIHIVYNFEAPYYLIQDGHEILLPNQLLTGQATKAMKIYYGSHVKQLGLAIKPSAIYIMFQQLTKFYQDMLVDCSEIPLLKGLHDEVFRLMEAPFKIDDVFDRLEEFFSHYNFDHNEADTINEFVSYIEASRGVVDIQSMAKSFNYSVSALERKFKKYIGVTPKNFADIVRFREAMREEKPEQLFYDQSHFIRYFKKYTSKVPRDIQHSLEISLLHMLGLK